MTEFGGREKNRGTSRAMRLNFLPTCRTKLTRFLGLPSTFTAEIHLYDKLAHLWGKKSLISKLLQGYYPETKANLQIQTTIDRSQQLVMYLKHALDHLFSSATNVYVTVTYYSSAINTHVRGKMLLPCILQNFCPIIQSIVNLIDQRQILLSEILRNTPEEHVKSLINLSVVH